MNKKIKTICVCVAITIVSLALLCIGWAMDVFFIRLLLAASLRAVLTMTMYKLNKKR